MFSVFGEDQLPPINTNASCIDISNWKRSSKVHSCFKKLPAYMGKIVDKIYGVDPRKRSSVPVAFAVALVSTMLNPKTDQIKVNEDAIKRSMEKYMVRN